MTDFFITSALLRYFSSSDPGPILRRPGPAAVKYAKTRAYKPLSSYPYECASTIPRGKPCMCVCVWLRACNASDRGNGFDHVVSQRESAYDTDRQTDGRTDRMRARLVSFATRA